MLRQRLIVSRAMLSRLPGMRMVAIRQQQQQQPSRTMASKPPGSDPMDVFRKECMARKLCDVDGSRLPGTHWVFCIATTPPSNDTPPNLRTVNIEKVSGTGIDFVVKRGSPMANRLASGAPVAVLHQQGQFLPGQSAEQWRGEGLCQSIPLGRVLDLVPHFTVTSLVASTRLAAEAHEKASEGVSPGRLAILSKSHVTEVVQKTRIALENGEIPMETLEESIAAFRFRPDRMECMLGGPDTLMWDRWEWMRDVDSDGEDDVEQGIAWAEAKHLIPH